MSSEKLHKYVVHGASSAVALKLLGSSVGASKMEISGVDVPIWAVGFAMGAISSVAGDVAVKQVLPEVDLHFVSESPSSALLAPAVSGATFLGSQALLGVSKDLGQKELFVSGALAEVVAGWVHTNVVHPYLHDEDTPAFD